MWQGFADSSISTSSFELLWMRLLGFGYFVFQLDIIGVIVHLIFFSILLSLPIIGLLYYRNKWQHILLHISLLIVVLILLGFIHTAYTMMWAFAGV